MISHWQIKHKFLPMSFCFLIHFSHNTHVHSFIKNTDLYTWSSMFSIQCHIASYYYNNNNYYCMSIQLYLLFCEWPKIRQSNTVARPLIVNNISTWQYTKSQTQLIANAHLQSTIAIKEAKDCNSPYNIRCNVSGTSCSVICFIVGARLRELASAWYARNASTLERYRDVSTRASGLWFFGSAVILLLVNYLAIEL
jgi:hypothetical protein